MELTRDALLESYRQMRMIRSFEEKLSELVAAGKLGGFLHLYAGEEAVAVGVRAHLGNKDFVASTHRGHGHCIAKGVDVAGMMAELFGRANVLFAGGYSGHGVPVAVLAGRLLRDLVAGEPLDPVYDFVLDRKPPRVPGEPLTSLGFGLAKRYMRWADTR